MAAKRKTSAPPAHAAQSSSSDADSSSDEEQFVAQPKPSKAETPKRNEPDVDESESETDSDSGSESESIPDPPTKTVNASRKPSEPEDSSEEEEEEEEKVGKLKSPVKEPESAPDKKKPKLPEPDQSPSNKNSSSFQRIWSLEDELALLRALSEYHVKNGRLPPRKDYKSFLSGISGSISFPVAENQLFNKIRQLRQTYNQKKKKGPHVSFSQPHDVAVYKFCKVLFEDSSKPSKEKVALEPSSDTGMESRKQKQKKKSKGLGSEWVANGGTTDGGSASAGVGNVGAGNGGAANVASASGGARIGGVASGRDMAGSHFYLDGLIKDMIRTRQSLGWISTVEDVVAMIGESRAQDLEVKTRMLRIDTIKLLMREEKLMAELFDILADEMSDD